MQVHWIEPNYFDSLTKKTLNVYKKKNFEAATSSAFSKGPTISQSQSVYQAANEHVQTSHGHGKRANARGKLTQFESTQSAPINVSKQQVPLAIVPF